MKEAPADPRRGSVWIMANLNTVVLWGILLGVFLISLKVFGLIT